jgi:hypothetical protein
MYIYICIYIIPTYIHTYIHMHLLLEHVFHLLQKERITQSQYVDKKSKYVQQIVENVAFGFRNLIKFLDSFSVFVPARFTCWYKL